MDNEKVLAECRIEFERHQSDDWKGCAECRFLGEGCWKCCGVVMKAMHCNGEFASAVPSGHRGTELRGAISVDYFTAESNEFWNELRDEFHGAAGLYDC